MKNEKTKFNNNKITIAFTGGGTGGHIYPGLAIVKELQDICLDNNLRIKIVWLGSTNKMDKDIVEKSKLVDKFYSIRQITKIFFFQKFYRYF